MRMRTIGFYSFKGGVGRSNLVMNIAYHLAKAGQHVGIMDLDLEAPGLTVAPPLSRPTTQVAYPDKGIIDFLQAAVKALPKADKKKQKDIELPDIKDIFYQTHLASQWSGSIFLAPAVSIPPHKDLSKTKSSGKVIKHRQGITYSGLIKKALKQKKQIGARIFSFLQDHIGKSSFPVKKQRTKTEKPTITDHKFDYLLVDLRTGLSELADTAIGTLLSELVIVCGLNTQNTEGLYTTLQNIEDIAAKAKENDLKMPIRITPVFSPLPNGEMDRVRKRFNIIHNKLLSISKKWFDAGDQLQLLIGVPGGSVAVSDHAPDDVPLYKIHYCDYLAVGDNVLLESYPETLAAREILTIAQRYTKKPEEYAAETQTALKNMGVFLDMRLDEQSAENAWDWVFSYFKQVPDWRWPLQIMGEDGFDGKDIEDKLTKDIVSKGDADLLMRGLAATISIKKEEKIRVIDGFSKLSEKQISELLRVLQEEQKKFFELDSKHAIQLGVKVLESFKQWPDVLANAGAKLVHPEKWLPQIIEKKISFPQIPTWAFYLAYILAKEEKNSAQILALKYFFQCSDLHPIVVITALKSISANMLASFKKDLKSILEKWIKEQEDKNIPAAISFQIAEILTDDLSLHRQAEIMYRYALKANSKDPNIYNSLGILLTKHLSRYKEAEAAYRKAIEINPEDADAWNNLGNLLKQHLSRYKEAEAAYRKAIKINPEDASAWYNLGILLTDHLSRYDEAEAAFNNAIKYHKGTDKVYGYYNDLRLLSFQLDNKADFDNLYNKACYWLEEEPLLLKNKNLENIHAALVALCKKNQRLKEILPYLQNKATDADDILWIKIIACTIGKAKENDIEPYTPQSLTANGLEESIQLTAMLRKRMHDDNTLSHLKAWFTDAIHHFVPRKGSRKIHSVAIAPYAVALNLEIPDPDQKAISNG